MKNTDNERLSIDINAEEHRLIKIHAARHGMTIRMYVLESLRRRLVEEQEEKEMSALTTQAGPVLKQLWDNPKDAEYDVL